MEQKWDQMILVIAEMKLRLVQERREGNTRKRWNAGQLYTKKSEYEKEMDL